MANHKVLLLIEDTASDIELTKRALDRAHIANPLVVAEDGQEGLDYIFGKGAHAGRDVNDLPALLLLDLNLPKISGLEILRRIRDDERTKRLPVVILSSSKEQEDVATGYDRGANGFVRKPVDSKEFAEAVSRLGLYWLLTNEPPPNGNLRAA
jgi:CheY-like chemotaxis protein